MCKNGTAHNLRYHRKRLKRSAHALFNADIDLDLTLITPPTPDIIHRCKVIYSNKIESVEFLPYIKTKVKKLKIVFSDEISYGHKFLDRGAIEELHAQKGSCDDIIIIKNGLLTDTSIANIALLDDNEIWVTPKIPLLYGTTRERLLDEGKIVERDVLCTDIFDYSKIAIMNALRGFEVLGSVKEVIELGDIG